MDIIKNYKCFILQGAKSRLFPSILISILFILPYGGSEAFSQNNGFSVKQVMSYPFPSGLTVSSGNSGIAWAVNKEGLRNIFVAEGPEFQARQLTDYDKDDGQAISSLSLSPDGKWCIYIRGGDFGSNWRDDEPVNALSHPDPPPVGIWSIPFTGGDPIMLAEGVNPVISPSSDKVAFTRGGQIWTVAIDGSEKASRLFTSRGNNGSPVWSPAGDKVAFRSSRGDHSFIGIYNGPDKPIKWIDPGYDHDSSPVWSPDGSHIAFIRRPGSGGAPDSALASIPRPWKIMVADINTNESHCAWESPYTMRGSVPSTQGGTNLHWGNNRIVFLSYHDGWPHLYSVDPGGKNLLLLTPGEFMAEYISISPDGKHLFFCGNTGPDKYDIDRRHIVMVSVDKQDMKVMTPGEGNEWTPFMTGDGKSIAYISAGPKRPPLVEVMDIASGHKKMLAAYLIPDDYPVSQLVKPYQAIFRSADGTNIHGTVFNNEDIKGQKPAVIFVHGGPPRQMLLGWHYSSYYSNAYAVNQYLASQGFVVLSVNFRLGIGYGYEFHHPANGGRRGASEYQDVLAAHKWLAEQDFVDEKRIGIYGGSYGGYLTAMALGRNSDLFAAGVDISGVHDWTARDRSSYSGSGGYEKVPDAEHALALAWESSPVADVEGWKSPGLIIHGDDDRNVDYNQSTDLVQRLRKLNAPFETMTLVDDTHHFMVYKNQVAVNEATVEFLMKHLKER
ncbi:MAG: prolyl oligopeptidase family serine peptidase [Bacteroidota bacterium]|nr:prolyl oligopeptidase family serine peptidase [Bacteroidota bacterium]